MTVTCSQLAYVGEFEDSDHDTLHLELFLLADTISGDISLENVAGSGPDELYIRDVRWFAREELEPIRVLPEIFRNRFWEDFTRGFPHAFYFGRH